MIKKLKLRILHDCSCIIEIVNPFMPNGIARPYQSDKNISNLWVVG